MSMLQYTSVKNQMRVGVALGVLTALGLAVSPPAEAASVWDQVAACESGNNWSINTGNGFFGGLQFTHETWIAFGGGAYASNANLASRSAQILIAQRVLIGEGPGAWPVCSIKGGLTRANGSGAVSVSRAAATVPVASGPVASGKIAVDGILGPKTIAKLQRWVGVSTTGVMNDSTVAAMQRIVGAPADGIIGPVTVRSLQIKIGAARISTSYLNRSTVASLQGYLNAH